jgi:hypothetical protein
MRIRKFSHADAFFAALLLATSHWSNTPLPGTGLVVVPRLAVVMRLSHAKSVSTLSRNIAVDAVILSLTGADASAPTRRACS